MEELKIMLPMADPLPRGCKQPQKVIIDISQSLTDRREEAGLGSNPGVGAIQKLFDCEAERLADALLNSLPQGVIEPLMVKLMARRVSLYHGVMGR